MVIVNFAVPKTLENRVNKAIRERGFASKAEFWRMSAVNYLKQTSDMDEQERIKALTNAIKDEVERKFRGKRLFSAREQLTNL